MQCPRLLRLSSLHTAINMSKSSYRDLLVWQKARVLAKDIYILTRAFPRDETFGLISQMRRSAISIASNIAEGQGRWNRRDYRRFLFIARGSTFELEAQIMRPFYQETQTAELTVIEGGQSNG